jgi:hypothetical protein
VDEWDSLQLRITNALSLPKLQLPIASSKRKKETKKADLVYVGEVDVMYHNEWRWGCFSLRIKNDKMVAGTLYVPLAMNPSQWVK